MALVLAPEVTDPRELALLKAVGLDRLAPEARELAINIASRYELDLMLKHLVLIDGRPYITRDGLLHIAHRSGVFDGVEVTVPEVVDGFWRCTASVYRKDMARPFTFPGRYPTTGGNQKYAPEMCIKVAESMAYRRAFDVAAPTQDERWDVDHAPVAEAPPKPSLAAVVAQKAAEVETPPVQPEPEGGEEYGDIVPVPVAEGQEDFELIAEDTTTLTAAQFKQMCEEHKVAPEFATSVRKQMWPEVTSWSQVTDEMRAQLMTELLR